MLIEKEQEKEKQKEGEETLSHTATISRIGALCSVALSRVRRKGNIYDPTARREWLSKPGDVGDVWWWVLMTLKGRFCDETVVLAEH